MSLWNRLPSGSKRRSDFTDPERPGNYYFPPPQQSHTSESSEVSTSPQSSQEKQTPKAVEHSPSLMSRTGISSDVVETRTDAFFHASSLKMSPPIPSPMSSAIFTVPSVALSSPRPALYTPHSSKLPSKLGTDYPSFQTLQRENTDLASAYAQAQVCIADLDTRIRASRAENGKLANERQRLTGRIEVLEAHLEELEQSIQQMREHTAAKDAQYSRIVEFSTRLQCQGAVESQARKTEQHAWSTEKESMQRVIDSLKDEIRGLRKAYACYGKPSDPTLSLIDDDLDGMKGNAGSAAESPSHGQIAEMEALRCANARMEDALAGVQGENAQLAEYIEKLVSVEKDIQVHLRRGEIAEGTLNALDKEDVVIVKEAQRRSEH